MSSQEGKALMQAKAYAAVKRRLGGLPGSSPPASPAVVTEQLLLDLIHVDAVSHYGSMTPNISQYVDGDYLFELAAQKGMAPLVYDALRQTYGLHLLAALVEEAQCFS